MIGKFDLRLKCDDNHRDNDEDEKGQIDFQNDTISYFLLAQECNAHPPQLKRVVRIK